MKIKIALSALLIATCSFVGYSQTTSSARKAHQEAHKAQLANHKSRLDNTIVNEIIQNDVKQREQASGLSAESSKMITDLLAEANRHIGKPYVHGAKGPAQFDCSGFTSYVYKQFGFNISPGSRIQATQGTPVSRKDLRKGDLVFFTSPRSGSAVGHVGMVVSADNEKGTFKFIHASIKGVKISDIQEGYYSKRYVSARRIIND